jgi:undecaprenyl phosphate-alpha-L-ara4N flippase subunit ArnE
MTAQSFLLIMFCIVTEIAREICFKIGVDRHEANPSGRNVVLRVILSPWIIAGLVLWAVEIVAWIVVLQTTPLHLAFPIMSLIYVGLPIASQWILNERMTQKHWAGAALICAGVAVIGVMGTGV